MKKNILLAALFSCMGFAGLGAAELIDLEKEMSDEFVTEVRKIEIPGHPYAFNPSLIWWDQGEGSGRKMLMSFRARYGASTNEIGLVFLDADMNIIGDPQIVEIPKIPQVSVSRQQDPRLVRVQEKLYLVYSNEVAGELVPTTKRMFIAQLHHDGFRFYAGVPEPIVHFDGQSERTWQKNWTPFEYQGELMLSYSVNPHRVMRYDFGSSASPTVAQTHARISWDWGHLRGGTAALRLGDKYLSFLHSSKDMVSAHSEGRKTTHYFMGAYVFNAEPPFEISAISPKPIVAKNFYFGADYKTWKPFIRVVFPCGFVMDEAAIWVAYGRQDFEVWIAKMDKQALLESLVPVQGEAR